MSTYNLLKGHNIQLKGEPVKSIVSSISGDSFAVHPSQYKGMKPKLLVKEGDVVKIGDPLFYDKTKELVKVVSPVSGKVESVVFGKRRVIEKISIIKEGESSVSLNRHNLDVDGAQFKDFLLESGLWSCLRQRPFSKVPDPGIKPRAIFLNMHQTAPFSLDLEEVLSEHKDALASGMRLLGNLTDGDIFLSLKKGSTFFDDCDLGNVKVNYFNGPHPSGNIGVQIHHIEPIANKNDTVYYLSMQNLLSIVKTFQTGEYCFDKIIACGGSGVQDPGYYRIKQGAVIKDIVGEIDSQKYRIISGDVLSGSIVAQGDSLNAFDETLSIIPEIQEREFVGWALPGLKKYSLSNTFISSALIKDKTDLQTGLNGSIRAIIPFGRWEKVLPMDIYPDFLIKSILSEDIDQMEKLGIYECDPEDFALCAFACQSKVEVSQIIDKGLALIEREG